MSDLMFCEMCGAPIKGRAYKVNIEGSVLTVCHRCYSRISTTPGSATPIIPKKKPEKKKSMVISRPRRSSRVEYDVVDDYAIRIKNAREKLGWTTMALAQRVMEKETVIKRIETGRLRPSIELARKLEKALNIVLLEPVAEEEISMGGSKDFELTLGDMANIRMRGKKKA